jgi:hypothetical protein
VFFGSMVGEQNARQRTMLGELAEANAMLETALADNTGLHDNGAPAEALAAALPDGRYAVVPGSERSTM